MRNGRRRGISHPCLHGYLDIVGGEYLDGRYLCRFRKRMCVHADEQRAVDAFTAAIIADRLADGENMLFVKGTLDGRSAVTGGAKCDLMCRVAGIRLVGKVRRHETRKVLQQLTGSRFAGEWMQSHGSDPFVPFYCL